jgi:hypothetical protein
VNEGNFIHFFCGFFFFQNLLLSLVKKTMTTSRGGKILHFLRAFFPLQLLFGHLKYNLFSLFFWAILFSIVADGFASGFGVPYLFFSPEYQGEISAFSFFLLGLSIGGFTMGFNLYSYMEMGRKYPFLATLSRPFFKFCWNNSIIPIIFTVYFIKQFSEFQFNEEFASVSQVVSYISMYLLGFFVYIIGSLLYFFRTNKDFFKLSGLSKNEFQEDPTSSFLHKQVSWSDLFLYNKDRTYIYMSGFLSWRTSRSIKHYDKQVLDRVFRQNKINASVFELITIAAFLLLGIFREAPVMELPAAVSIVLLLAIILMVIAIFKSWFLYWSYALIIFCILGMNFLSKNTEWFHFKSFAFGLSYKDEDKKDYSIQTIYEHSQEFDVARESKEAYIQRLNTWKAKTGVKKPKLVVLLTSGGGLRSTHWTYSVMQELDRQFGDTLMNQLQFMTGASGGMVGAAYYRELALRDKLEGTRVRLSSQSKANTAKDLLNRLSVSTFSNDLFLRYQKVKYAGNYYTKERGYAFEQHLLSNTDNVLNHPLSYYRNFEQKAFIPTMIFTPTIANDGRRLIIGSSSMAFLCHSEKNRDENRNSYENIDFHSFFNMNLTDSIRFSNVIRMSATFPFILPMVSMPTKPEMLIMDAGLRDNYGGKIAMEFLNEMEEWIEKNTSGVIILQIRDTKKVLNNEQFDQITLTHKLSLPFGNMYKNFPRTQDFDQDALMKIGFKGFDFPVDIVAFNLREAQKDRISLSWHLTRQEKKKIENALYSEANQKAYAYLKSLLKSTY